MESLLNAVTVRSGRTTDAIAVPVEKVHNFSSDCSIALKLLEKFWSFRRMFSLEYHGIPTPRRRSPFGSYHRLDCTTG